MFPYRITFCVVEKVTAKLTHSVANVRKTHRHTHMHTLAKASFSCIVGKNKWEPDYNLKIMVPSNFFVACNLLARAWVVSTLHHTQFKAIILKRHFPYQLSNYNNHHFLEIRVSFAALSSISSTFASCLCWQNIYFLIHVAFALQPVQDVKGEAEGVLPFECFSGWHRWFDEVLQSVSEKRTCLCRMKRFIIPTFIKNFSCVVYCFC